MIWPICPMLADQFGVLSAHLARHVETLPNITRANSYRMLGSWLAVWDDLRPSIRTQSPRGGCGNRLLPWRTPTADATQHRRAMPRFVPAAGLEPALSRT